MFTIELGLKAIFSASPSEFKKVDGFGDVIAERIWKIINSP